MAAGLHRVGVGGLLKGGCTQLTGYMGPTHPLGME